ncbi:MAG TPA: M23 family metallopeptidase [Burkholderiales bacterium]|nr:M23 family metallopeptidase [Burkholderiales bacterium]
MQIILIPEGIRKGIPACFNSRHLTLFVLVALVLLPAMVGILSYKLADYYDRQHNSALSSYRKELMQSRTALRKTREESVRHLNALALKMGTLQAQVLRLNALGSRLTRMAGLDGREFSFDTAPGVGGPEKVTQIATVSSPDITRNMDVLAHDLRRSQARLMALESAMIDRKLTEAVTPAGWPVQGGWVSSGFGTRMDPFTGHQAVHEGVDIAARLGGPVFAMGEGVVSFAGEKPGYGMLVEVTHESGLTTRYSHCSATLVKEGDKVMRGQEIAKVGTTGRSTGPHLHFEVIRNGQPVNPIAYLDSSVPNPNKKATVAAF